MAIGESGAADHTGNEKPPTAPNELHAGETALAYQAMADLRAGRPQLATLETFVAWVDDYQRPEGYRLLGAFAEGRTDAVAVAGFRRLHSLAWGDYLYVDDLGTLPEYRGRGHADALFDWLFTEAQRLDCAQLHLDSGMHRHTAHRFYLKHRLNITSLHFQRTFDQTGE